MDNNSQKTEKKEDETKFWFTPIVCILKVLSFAALKKNKHMDQILPFQKSKLKHN